MDILAALHDANPSRGTKRCKLQRFLDSIDDATPGKADLVAAVNDLGFAALRLTLTFSALEHPISSDLIRDHRGQRCCCYR
jgi:hypothetical protein